MNVQTQYSRPGVFTDCSYAIIDVALCFILVLSPTLSADEPLTTRIHYDPVYNEMVLSAGGQPSTGLVYEVYSTADAAGLQRLKSPAWRVEKSRIHPGADNVLLYDALSTDERFKIYAVGVQHVDANGNAVPDAREKFIDVFLLPETNRSLWALSGYPGPFPSYSHTNNVRDFGAVGDGISDDSGAFLKAIDLAPEGSVVWVPSGTYRLTQRLYLKSRMILRGEGANRSRLYFSGSGTSGRSIGMIRWDSDQTHPYRTVKQAVRGSRLVTLSTVSDFSEGDFIEIEQDNKAAWGLEESWQVRLEGQVGRVAAVDPDHSRLTLEIPLRFDADPARAPRARKLQVIQDAGIEDLYIEKRDAVDGYTVEMKYAVQCWMKHVESYNTYKAHVWMSYGYRNDITGCYFHHAHVYGGGGQGYGVGCGRHTSDARIENNVFSSLRHAMIVGVGANGNVFGYNHSSDRAADPKSGMKQADISVHGNYVFLNLFEGNVLEDADVPDWYFPAGPGNTLFRNRILNEGIAIEVASDKQIIVANELPAGTIAEAPGVTDYFAHGNVQTSRVVWSSAASQILPESMYRIDRPPFYPSDELTLPWPGVGPECGPSVFYNPAHKRAVSGAYLPE